MNEVTNTPLCDRGNDLVSFLYGEANDKEAREFERHLQECTGCRSEMASFGQLRGSIGAWKEEALSVFVPPQVTVPVKKKSAVAALREFFDLSPLWMKGAVGFATILFCVMLGLLVFRSGGEKNSIKVAENDTLTRDQVNQIVNKALEDQAASLAAARNQQEQKQAVAPVAEPKRNRTITSNGGATQTAKRRSLSRSEREQLAADLRLFSTRDDENLNLLGDKINQEF